MADSDFEAFNFEQSASIMKLRRLRSLAKLFRFAELFAAVAFLAWLSTLAPLAVKASGEYLRRVSAAVSSRVFVFFLGNAIVVALFAKSGLLGRSAGEIGEVCEELRSDVVEEIQVAMEKEIVFQDKEIVFEEVAKAKANVESLEIPNPRVSDSDPPRLRPYRRSESEKIECANREDNGILRRSVTDIRRDRELAVSGKSGESEDAMSSDEFRRTIEEFIAKQVKFIREESNSALVHT